MYQIIKDDIEGELGDAMFKYVRTSAKLKPGRRWPNGTPKAKIYVNLPNPCFIAP